MWPVAKYFTLLLFFLASVPAAAQRIDRAEAVQIGGLQQWIQIKGEATQPLLLFLHGGPGNSMMAYAHKFTNQLEREFLVVHWDQPESGKTKKLNSTERPLTVDQYVEDAVALIRWLTNQYQQPKVFLVGHSWGGFLGLAIAKQQPGLLYGCIAVSPMIHQNQSEQMALDQMMAWATEKKNESALTDLRKIKIPFETTDDLHLHRKWLALMDGRKAPDYSFVKTWSNTWLPLFQEASGINLFETSLQLDCPVFFIVGTRDYQCHYQLTQKYADGLKAPKKDFFPIAHVGHSVPSVKPEYFQRLLLEIKSRIVH